MFTFMLIRQLGAVEKTVGLQDEEEEEKNNFPRISNENFDRKCLMKTLFKRMRGNCR